jgi:hypothetical protein
MWSSASPGAPSGPVLLRKRTLLLTGACGGAVVPDTMAAGERGWRPAEREGLDLDADLPALVPFAALSGREDEGAEPGRAGEVEEPGLLFPRPSTPSGPTGDPPPRAILPLKMPLA